MKNKLLFVINMKCISPHQNIGSNALRKKNVQAKEIDLPGGDNKSFCHKKNNRFVCVIHHANLLSKILYENIIGFHNLNDHLF